MTKYPGDVKPDLGILMGILEQYGNFNLHQSLTKMRDKRSADFLRRTFYQMSIEMAVEIDNLMNLSENASLNLGRALAAIFDNLVAGLGKITNKSEQEQFIQEAVSLMGEVIAKAPVEEARYLSAEKLPEEITQKGSEAGFSPGSKEHLQWLAELAASPTVQKVAEEEQKKGKIRGLLRDAGFDPYLLIKEYRKKFPLIDWDEIAEGIYNDWGNTMQRLLTRYPQVKVDEIDPGKIKKLVLELKNTWENSLRWATRKSHWWTSKERKADLVNKAIQDGSNNMKITLDRATSTGHVLDEAFSGKVQQQRQTPERNPYSQA